MPAPGRNPTRFAEQPAIAPLAAPPFVPTIEVNVPVVRPFRALRHDADVVPQKCVFVYSSAGAGLVINPLEG